VSVILYVTRRNRYSASQNCVNAARESARGACLAADRFC
jgi:hypothetical protein